MKFMANENFPSASVRRLRDSGYDVTAVVEETPGAEDEDILSRANREKQIILTFDRDYGELIYKLRKPVPAGVVYFRFNPSTPIEPAEYMLQLLSEGVLFENKFTVVDRDRLRQRPLLYIV